MYETLPSSSKLKLLISRISVPFGCYVATLIDQICLSTPVLSLLNCNLIMRVSAVVRGCGRSSSGMLTEDTFHKIQS